MAPTEGAVRRVSTAGSDRFEGHHFAGKPLMGSILGRIDIEDFGRLQVSAHSVTL